MALVVADRVKETTTTTGTGAITLAGATTNFVTFSSVLSNGDTTYYAIVDDANTDFEVGLGTYASSGNTLTRTTVLASTNSGSAVNLSAGSKEVFITYPADKSVNRDASGNVSVSGGVTATSFTGNITGNVTGNITGNVTGNVTGDVTGDVTGAVTATQVDITARGDLRLQDSAGGQYVGLQAPATVSSSFVLSLPAADGSANQMLKTDGSGNLGFTTVASGGLVHLSTITASGASTVDVESTFDSTYDAYRLIVTDYTAATDGQQVQILMKIGGSYQTNNYRWASITHDTKDSGRSDRSGVGVDTYIMMGLSYGNDAYANANFVIDIYNPADTAIRHVIRYEGTYFEDDNDIHVMQGLGMNETTGALTGLRIKAGSGNVSGRFRLYGITNG